MSESGLDTLRAVSPRPARRRLAACVGGRRRARRAAPKPSGETPAGPKPFWGAHQAGIVTPAQSHTLFHRVRSDDRASATMSPLCCGPGPRPPPD